MSSLQSAIDLLMGRASSEGTDKYTPGVAVLKAAEKMDKNIASKMMKELSYFLVPRDKRDSDFIDFIKEFIKLRALLEALPDNAFEKQEDELSRWGKLPPKENPDKEPEE